MERFTESLGEKTRVEGKGERGNSIHVYIRNENYNKTKLMIRVTAND